MRIVIEGNPIDGFSYYGPFDDADDIFNFEAIDWATENIDSGDWWVVSLTEVNK